MQASIAHEKQDESSYLKHLEFIQGVINRMSQNSANTKGWATLLLGAALAFRDEGAKLETFLALIPAFAFWLLDSYYLQQERLFRELFLEATRREAEVFSMDTRRFRAKVGSLIQLAFSKSVALVHGAVVGGILIKLFYPA